MPDTPANQMAYPQLRSQKAGLGFPRLRLVVLLAFATASLVGGALGPVKGKGTGETELFRRLLGQVEAGDVVVADRYYCTWWLVALLRRCQADVCFRLHQLRHYDFCRGRQLGPGDHVVRSVSIRGSIAACSTSAMSTPAARNRAPAAAHPATR